eukprot:GHVS01066139.1.p1 GENE.GHVS01066139.1~~GHVS01066139.1.p1  ORF type:complete len:564 (+),score=61.03 GHVS01066139.1:1100-2791(+)
MWQNMDSNSNDLKGYSHGTKVAGCIAAVTDNGIGISGTCPNCHMLAVTVAGSVSSELAAVNYILSKGVKIINLSVGGPRSEAEHNTFKQNQHALFVVAAGNEACDLDRIGAPIDSVPCLDMFGSAAGFPASLSSELLNVLSVGSITRDGQISSFSSIGATRVQLFAPGSAIYTTNISDGNPSYSSRSGTSYAAPIVAGVAGLVLQKYPSLSSCQLREALIQGCVEDIHLEGKAECNGHLSAFAALKEGERISLDLSLYSCEDGLRSQREAGRAASVIAEVKPTQLGAGSGAASSAEVTSRANAVSGTKPGLRKVGGEPSNGRTITNGEVQAGKGSAMKPTVKDGTVKAPAGEFFLEAIVVAIAKSGILVNAEMLEVTVSMLLSLFSNVVDPFAIKTNGVPVRKYLHDFEKMLSLEPVYADVNGLSRGPISLLLNPLGHAKNFLSSTQQLRPQKPPKNGSVPLDFGFGINIIEPLVFGKMMAMELLNLNGDNSNSSGGDAIPGLSADPLQLWLLKKQLKQLKKGLLTNPLEAVQGPAMQVAEKLLLQKLKPFFGGKLPFFGVGE